MRTPASIRWMVCFAAVCCLTVGELHAEEPAAAWQKFKGKPETIPASPTFATPGMFLNLPPRQVAFPAGGLPIDLPLEATLPGGKPVKASVLANRYLWIDGNSDGQVDAGEKFAPTHTGYGPVTVALEYANGTQSPYSFHLVQTPTAGTYELRTGQMVRFTATWQRRRVTFLLLDQNNNGRYNDMGQDVILVDQRPGGLLAKTVTVGVDAGSVCDIVVYPDGATLELRDYAGPTGVLDPVSGYKPPQEGVTLAYLAMDHALARPGFSAQFPRARVPVGSYDFVSASLVRGTETVRVDKGGLQAAAVAADANTVLAWGGTVELKYGFRRDGEFLVFDGFKFVGKDHQEVYLPQPPYNLRHTYRAEELRLNPLPGPTGAPLAIVLQAGNLEEDQAGGYKPLQVKHKGRHMFLQMNFNYLSGVMGTVNVRDKMEFTPPDENKQP